MVQQVILVDDLTGEDADETVVFEIDGQGYEIDLATRNAERLRKAEAEALADNEKALERALKANEERLRKALEEFTAVGRPVAKRGRKRGSTRPKVKRDYDIAALRAWAKKKKIELPQRGRIPRDVVDAYKAGDDK